MLANLSQFRQSAYELLNFAQDSTFELMDAILTTKSLKSFPELSFSPLFRRQWSSLDESIEDCRPNGNKLMKLYLQQMSEETRPLIAGDHTPWPRPEAKTLKDRTYEHSPLTKAAFQLRLVCQQMKARAISLWDSEYSNVTFLQSTADIPVDKLIRIRPNRCLWTAPPPYSGKGRPRVHGDKFKLSEPETYPLPDIELMIEDPLPWQKRQLRSEMTPGRVAQGLASLLAVIGTPAKPSKLRGKSTGWKKGRKRNKKIKFPVVKKTYSRTKKKNKKKK